MVTHFAWTVEWEKGRCDFTVLFGKTLVTIPHKTVAKSD